MNGIGILLAENIHEDFQNLYMQGISHGFTILEAYAMLASS